MLTMKVNPINRLILIGAVFVIATAGLPRAEANEKQIADLENDIAALKAKVAELGGPGNASVQLRSNIATAKAEIEKTKAALPAKEKALAAKSFLLGIYQSAFRVVTSMVAGQNLGTIQLANGEVVPGASFLKVDKGGILVQTATGSRSIPIAQLPATLSGMIQQPPTVAPLSMTLESIKASKPASLQTEEELAAASAATAVPVATAGTATTAAQPAPAGAAPTTSPDDAYLQVQQRNTARQKQIFALKARYSELYAEKKKVRDAQALDDAKFRSAKIKKSRTEIDGTMSIHNSKLQNIEAEEAKIRDEMSRIQSEFE
jgi:hypothetical protein